MENLNEKDADVLFEAMKGEGEPILFTSDEVQKSGRDYMIACKKNEERERIHQAKVWKDASRIIIF
jgi:hypothetical protein